MADARFTLDDTPLAGLKLVERSLVGDERGFLSRLYCAEELSAAGFVDPIAQINQTLTHAPGAIRGLHCQHPPFAEDKFVSVLHGEILDVAVDLRGGSPTFLHWHGAILSRDNRRSLFIPKGFAHGFQTLSPDCELLYLHTRPYHAAAEAGLNALDPRLAIAWPLPITDMSARDRGHPMVTTDFTGIAL